MEEKEIWKSIKGYEGYYEVSNLGRVKSLQRLVWNGSGMFMLKERILNHNITKNRYHLVVLSKDGKHKKLLVSRLVFEAFIGEIPYGMQVNHISEDKSDNRLSNLNLMTPKENANWGTRNERSVSKRRKKVVMDEEIEFDSMTKAAAYLGCFPSNVSYCCKHPTSTVYGHHFKYKEESK